MDNLASEICRRIAIIREISSSSPPKRKMGRQMVSWSFNSHLEKASGDPIKYIEPGFPLNTIRHGQLKKEALFIGDPSLIPYSEERLWDRPDRFSIIGITHTLSTPGPLDSIPKILHAPIFPWDALICTSKSAQNAVTTLWQNQEEIILARGGKAANRPQLPVIPLGINASSFKNKYTRTEARNKLEISNEASVVLWTGRLELHCKAHHSSTFRSVQIASDICSDKKWILLMYGTSIMPNIENALKEAAAFLCSSVEVKILNGHDIELGEVARAASDMFISLADSYQETFGLTPIEAMASELPVVASNWNGYRESIVDSETGFLIDTKSYEPGLKNKGLQQLLRQNNQLDYLSAVMSSQIDVDVVQAGSALAKLSSSKITARAMGYLGAQRAMSTYDWSKILEMYLDLLKSLKEIRECYSKTARNIDIQSIPAITKIFESWPSHALNLDAKFLRDKKSAELSQMLDLSITKIYANAIPSFDLLKEVYNCFDTNEPFSGSSILETLNGSRRNIEYQILLSIGWLNKHGFLREVRE